MKTLIKARSIIVLLCAFIVCYSCKTTEIQNNTIENAKKQFCYQFIFWEDDTIRCPDSVHIVKLNQRNLYLSQSFYGSGYGNGVMIYLIEIKKNSYKILDSALSYWHSDLFSPEKVEYDNKSDWFIYIDEGNGTGHYSEWLHLVRVANNSLVELFSFPKYTSDIDIEINDNMKHIIDYELNVREYREMKSTITKADKKQLVLHSVYQHGTVNLDTDEKESLIEQLEDESVFLFSDFYNCFFWQKSSNPRFEKLWNGTYSYPNGK